MHGRIDRYNSLSKVDFRNSTDEVMVEFSVLKGQEYHIYCTLMYCGIDRIITFNNDTYSQTLLIVILALWVV